MLCSNKMMRGLIVAIFILSGGLTAAVTAQKVSRETIESQGRKRTYYLMVPENSSADHPAPLVLLLHGSGHNGQSLMDKWKDLGVKERIILVAPDASIPESWRTPQDGPDFLHDLLSELKTKYPIDERRMYVFGHSG